MAAICQGLGMNIMVYDPFKPSQEILDKYGATFVDLDKLFTDSDVVTLHCPLTPDTKHIINKKNLYKMRKHALIINTGRGPLINAKDAI
jgi:D-lactate dehydrogenase